jgi:hypothetical protein
MPHPNVDILSSRVLDAAIHADPGVPGQAKVEAFDTHAERLEAVLFDGTRDIRTDIQIKGRMTLACTPSLRAIAEGGNDLGLNVAEQVYRNLLGVAGYVEERGAHLDQSATSLERGVVGEFGVLAIGWWAVKTGRLPTTSHASPANRLMDSSRIDEKFGGRLGADVFLKEGVSGDWPKGRKHHIQVKVGGTPSDRKRYSPRIPVVALRACLPPEYTKEVCSTMTQSLLTDDEEILAYTWDNIWEELDKSPYRRRTERRGKQKRPRRDD